MGWVGWEDHWDREGRLGMGWDGRSGLGAGKGVHWGHQGAVLVQQFIGIMHHGQQADLWHFVVSNPHMPCPTFMHDSAAQGGLRSTLSCGREGLPTHGAAAACQGSQPVHVR